MMNWSYSYSPDLWPAIITLSLTIFLGAYSWRRRHIPAAKPFTVACVFGGLWALGVIMELSAIHYPAQIVWMKFQAIWQLPAAAAITCFVLQYAGLGRWLTRRNYVFLSLVPLLAALLMITNDFHHLIWTGFNMDIHVTGSPGRLFWAFVIYGILLGLLNFLVLIWLAITSPIHRWPVAIMLVGQITGRLGYTLDKLDNDLIGPGESVFIVVGIVSTAYALAFLRFHTIDPVAAARKAAIEQMREGLFVLDLQGRISDANPMAGKILGIPANQLRNKLFKDVMPVDMDQSGQLENRETVQTDITLGKDNAARQYRLNWTALMGRHGEVIGQLLLMYDITEHKRAQARILEQQSVVATLQERDRLARELHDGLAQILGYVSMQAQTALKLVRDGNNEKAQSLLGRIVEVTRDAHVDVRESIFNLRTGAGQGWSFIPTLQNYIDKFQANYGIRTELSLSDGIEENTFDPSSGLQLLRVIQEAMTNCRKHSGAQTLKVCVELDGHKSHITISDDGEGFDTGQPGNDGGSHFGLIFMRERMEQIGGSLGINSTPGGGTVLQLAVPIREQGGKSYESTSG